MGKGQGKGAQAECFVDFRDSVGVGENGNQSASASLIQRHTMATFGIDAETWTAVAAVSQVVAALGTFGAVATALGLEMWRARNQRQAKKMEAREAYTAWLRVLIPELGMLRKKCDLISSLLKGNGGFPHNETFEIDILSEARLGILAEERSTKVFGCLTQVISEAQRSNVELKRKGAEFLEVAVMNSQLQSLHKIATGSALWGIRGALDEAIRETNMEARTILGNAPSLF